jgi:hypothetical protein
MSDRELLELAAKAAKGAGLDIEFNHETGKAYDADAYEWDPQLDSRAALELATALEIDIEFHVNVEAIAWGRWSSGEQRHVFQESGLSLEATRRAIFRAAAAIGKEMQ